MRIMSDAASPLARLKTIANRSDRLCVRSLGSDHANDKTGYPVCGDPRTPTTRSGFQVVSPRIDRLA